MLFATNSTATTSVYRVRLRSTMCVPPCEAGVKPMPPMPASRPLCMRISPTRTKTRSTCTTARKAVTPARVAKEAGLARPDLDDRLDQLGGDPVLRDVAGGARLAGAIDVRAGVGAREHQHRRAAACGANLAHRLD